MIPMAREEGATHLVSAMRVDGSCFRVETFCSSFENLNVERIDYMVSPGEFKKGDDWCHECIVALIKRGG